MEKPLKETFSKKKEDSSGNNVFWQSQDVQQRPKSFYGVERGNRFVRRFKLIMRTGQMVSVPYALLPIVILEADKSLRIKAHDLEITVKGRNLQKVEEWLNEEKILWLREAGTDFDDKEEYDVFIQSIGVEGELFF